MQGVRPSCSNSSPAVLPHGEDRPPTPAPGLWGSPSEPIKKWLVLREVVALRWNPWTGKGIKRFLIQTALKRGCGKNGVHRWEAGAGGGLPQAGRHLEPALPPLGPPQGPLMSQSPWCLGWHPLFPEKLWLCLTRFIQKTIITYKHRLRGTVVQVGAVLQDN